MTRQKPPVIEGRIPNTHEIYNLDDPDVQNRLGLNPEVCLKIADEYDHYSHCKWAVIEYKSRSLKNSVEQIEDTAKQLSDAQREIHFAIIVTRRINRNESSLYGKRKNILYNKITKKPVLVRTGSESVVVNIYEPNEIDEQYEEYNKGLGPWVSK